MQRWLKMPKKEPNLSTEADNENQRRDKNWSQGKKLTDGIVKSQTFNTIVDYLWHLPQGGFLQKNSEKDKKNWTRIVRTE